MHAPMGLARKRLPRVRPQRDLRSERIRAEGRLADRRRQGGRDGMTAVLAVLFALTVASACALIIRTCDT